MSENQTEAALKGADLRKGINHVGVLLPAHIVESEVIRVPASKICSSDHVNGRVCRVCRRDIGRGKVVRETAVEVVVLEWVRTEDCRGKERNVKERKHPA